MTTNLVYRKLRPTDLGSYYEIIFSVKENLYHAHQIKYLQREWLLSDINQGGGSMCFDSDIAVGVSMPLFVPEPLLATLYIRPEYQNRGIGEKLHNLSLSWLQTNGAEEVSLETDAKSRAVQFYQRLGWKENGQAESEYQIKLTLSLKNKEFNNNEKN
jgi:GNAT superfamily N-acetyltransferase